MTFIETEVFRKAAEAIACLEPDMMTGAITVDQVKIAISEHLDVWPMSIFEEGTDDQIDCLEDGTSPLIDPEPEFITEEEDVNPSGLETSRTA